MDLDLNPWTSCLAFLSLCFLVCNEEIGGDPVSVPFFLLNF